jgi:hypothetical protein
MHPLYNLSHHNHNNLYNFHKLTTTNPQVQPIHQEEILLMLLWYVMLYRYHFFTHHVIISGWRRTFTRQSATKVPKSSKPTKCISFYTS